MREAGTLPSAPPSFLPSSLARKYITPSRRNLRPTGARRARSYPWTFCLASQSGDPAANQSAPSTLHFLIAPSFHLPPTQLPSLTSPRQTFFGQLSREHTNSCPQNFPAFLWVGHTRKSDFFPPPTTQRSCFSSSLLHRGKRPLYQTSD